MVFIVLGAAKLAQIAVKKVKTENRRNEIISDVSATAQTKQWWDHNGPHQIPHSNRADQHNDSASSSSSSQQIGAWSRNTMLPSCNEVVLEKSTNSQQLGNACCSSSGVIGNVGSNQVSVSSVAPIVSMESDSASDRLPNGSNSPHVSSSPPLSSKSSHSSSTKEAQTISSDPNCRENTILVKDLIKNGSRNQDKHPVKSLLPNESPHSTSHSAFANTNTTKRFARSALPRPPNVPNLSHSENDAVTVSLPAKHAAVSVSVLKPGVPQQPSVSKTPSAVPANAVKIIKPSAVHKVQAVNASSLNLLAKPQTVSQQGDSLIARGNSASETAAVTVKSSMASTGAMRRPDRFGHRVNRSVNSTASAEKASTVPVSSNSELNSLSNTPQLPNISAGSCLAAPGAMKKRTRSIVPRS